MKHAPVCGVKRDFAIRGNDRERVLRRELDGETSEIIQLNVPRDVWSGGEFSVQKVRHQIKSCNRSGLDRVAVVPQGAFGEVSGAGDNPARL